MQHLADRAADIPQPRRGDALLVVDVQNDFLPGGTLAVANGDEVVPVLNCYIAAFESQRLPIVFTRDWHPPAHCSFRSQGGPWPPHCVADTPGAAFATGLHRPDGSLMISKATEPQVEAYSAFSGTTLAQQLRALGIDRVFIGGLATDYCVRATAEDALNAGFHVVVLTDAVRAVDPDAAATQRVLADLSARGAVQRTLADIGDERRVNRP